MAKRTKVKVHPVLAVVTAICGGKTRVAKAFLDQLFRAGFHVAENRGPNHRKPVKNGDAA